MPDFLVPRTAGATVEQDEVSFIDGTSALVHIACRLLQSSTDGFLDVATENLQFQDNALQRIHIVMDV